MQDCVHDVGIVRRRVSSCHPQHAALLPPSSLVPDVHLASGSSCANPPADTRYAVFVACEAYSDGPCQIASKGQDWVENAAHSRFLFWCSRRSPPQKAAPGVSFATMRMTKLARYWRKRIDIQP